MESLTERQAQLLAYIKQRISANNVAPSYVEMRDHLGLSSKSSVHRLVYSLIDRGHIKIKPGARRIRVIEP